MNLNSEKSFLFLNCLVENGIDVNAKDKDRNTALICASKNNNLEIVKYLVDVGADLNAEGGHYNKTALMYASENGRLEMVKYLVEKGADVNQKGGYYYKTALMLASLNGHLSIVKFLV